jgi:homogentisate 1,2-dioxygenase
VDAGKFIPIAFGLQMRWFPQPLPKPVGESKAAAEKTEDVDELDWVDGLATMAGAGDPTVKSGIAVHMYTCNKSMVDTALFNSDGDFLIVPQEGTLHIQTEMGFLDVEPKEIVVIQRGIRFRVGVDGPSRGYVLEIFGGHFQLPDLGPIGSNGLANARDFLYPVASYEDRDVDYVILNKYGGHLWSSISHHSPFDVVAWHGNYAPYKYDLSKFNTMNSVSYDHPDPSIYTVLTAPTDTPGVALCDFVIFPPRWMVMDRSFRPPYYHRNLMSEFMGMVWGKYDAKVGFQPGGASLHSCMTPHGPDADTFVKASTKELVPEYFGSGLAFMFESTLMFKLTDWALHAAHRDVEYQKCWQTLPRVFNPAVRDVKALTITHHPIKGATEGTAHGPRTGTGESVLLHSAHHADTTSGVKRKRPADE